MHDTGCLGLGQPRGMVWGGRREEGSGWGTHIYLCRIHFDIWQNRYNIVKLKNKIKLNKKKIESFGVDMQGYSQGHRNVRRSLRMSPLVTDWRSPAQCSIQSGSLTS